MITGRIALQGFELRVHNGEAAKIVDGRPTEEKVPLKILVVTDRPTGLEVHLVFTPEQFDQFAEQMQGASSKIVRTPADSFSKFFTRNGGIR